MPRTVQLYGVKFDDKVDGAAARVLEIVAPAGLERTYGVKL
jgi:hypothetical protein